MTKQIEMKIKELKNEIESIMEDMENTEKYNNSSLYIQANDRISEAYDEIQSLEWQLITFKSEIKIESEDLKNKAIMAIEMVQSKLNRYLPCDFKVDEKELRLNKANGLYFLNSIIIGKETTLREIIHEIGHHVHDIINEVKPLRVPKTTEYSKKSGAESFAEAFSFWIIESNNKAYQKGMERIEKIVNTEWAW